MLGQKVMPTELAMALINGAGGMQPADGRSIAHYGLSDRETEILRCLVSGDANKVIANRSEEHTSELQSLMRISYAVFCLKKKKNINRTTSETNVHTSNI